MRDLNQASSLLAHCSAGLDCYKFYFYWGCSYKGPSHKRHTQVINYDLVLLVVSIMSLRRGSEQGRPGGPIQLVIHKNYIKRESTML